MQSQPSCLNASEVGQDVSKQKTKHDKQFSILCKRCALYLLQNENMALQ